MLTCTESSGSSGTSTTTTESPPNPAQEAKKGLTTEAIIGIAVGLPGALVAVITLYTLLRKHRNDRKTKYSQAHGGSVGAGGGGFPWNRHGPQQPVHSPPPPQYSAAPTHHTYEMSGNSAQRGYEMSGDPIRRGW